MRTALRPALIVFGLLTLLSGVVYPLAVTALAQVAMPWRANGSMLERGGVVVGSELIGQPFGGPAYFHGRPSATPGAPCNASASGGSNLGPSNPALAERAHASVGALEAEGGVGPIPADLVTASGSGLDPHISPAGAAYQVARVATARGRDPREVAALVERHTERPTLGFLGQPRVNVPRLNLALDEGQ